MAKKKDRQLDPQEQPRVAYKMPPPNDDQHAYGWDLKRVRKPVVDGKSIEPGMPIFDIKQPYEIRLEYGMDIQFLDPHFVHLRLSQSADVQSALESVKEQKYTQAALSGLEVTIQTVFDDLMLAEIRARFKQIVPMLANFYAARKAYLDKYGKD